MKIEFIKNIIRSIAICIVFFIGFINFNPNAILCFSKDPQENKCPLSQEQRQKWEEKIALREEKDHEDSPNKAKDTHEDIPVKEEEKKKEVSPPEPEKSKSKEDKIIDAVGGLLSLFGFK